MWLAGMLLGMVACSGEGGDDAATPHDAGDGGEAELDAAADASLRPDATADGGADLSGPDGGPGDTGPGADLQPDGAVPDQGFPCSSTADCPGCGLCDLRTGLCVPCVCRADADCAADRICEEHDCVPDCRQTGCPAETECDPAVRRCVPREGCRRHDDCPGLTVCVEERCVAADPWASCDTPQPLEPGAGFAASTRRTRDLTAGSCSRQPSPEAVFSFTLAEAAGVRIRIDGSADHFDPLVYLREGSCSDGAEIACRDTPFLSTERLDLAELPPGDYFLFVESFGPLAVGDFRVQVDFVPGGLCVDDRLEDNDAPEAAVDLALVPDGPLVLCPGDADWYRLPLFAGDALLLALALAEGTDPAAVQVVLLGPDGAEIPLAPVGEPAPPQGGLLPEEDGGEVGAGTTIRLRASALPATGPYLVGVTGGPDGPAALPFGYTLGYEVFTSHGSLDCTNPSSLTPGQPVAGDTRDGENRTAASCTSGLMHDAPEVVYKLHLDEESSVTLEVDADWLYALYLRRACRSALAEDELGCRAPGRLFWPALAAGTYYVFVDGFAEGAGPYTLLLDVGPALHPPANDLCAGALEIADGQVVEGTTQLATNNYRASCTSPLSHEAPDVVYRFTLAEERQVTAELRPVGAAGEPWAATLYIQSTCGSMASEAACDNALEPRVSALLPAGEHFLIVDGWRNAWGPFSLSLRVE